MRDFRPQLEPEHRISNAVQTLLLIGGMMLLLGLTGELLFGDDSFLWMASLTGLFLLMSPKLPPSFILRLYRARPMATWQVPQLYQLVSGLAHRHRKNNRSLLVLPFCRKKL